MSETSGWDEEEIPRFMNEWDLEARGRTRTEQPPAKDVARVTYFRQPTGRRLITLPSPEEERRREERYAQLSKMRSRPRRAIQI